MILQSMWKYKDYIVYSAINNLQRRYKNMYLGVIWIFLDPLLFVSVLTFVYLIISQNRTEYFVVYIIIGLIVWKWISSSINSSANSIYSKMGIIEQVSVPKQIFPLIDILFQTMIFLITSVLIIVFIIIYQIPITWHIIEAVPITLALFTFLFGVGLVVANYGAKIADFKIGLSYVVWLGFFLTPIFYELSSIPEEIQQYYYLNPAVTFVEAYRDAFLYGASPDYFLVGIWFFIGLGLVVFGSKVISLNDKKYVMLK